MTTSHPIVGWINQMKRLLRSGEARFVLGQVLLTIGAYLLHGIYLPWYFLLARTLDSVANAQAALLGVMLGLGPGTLRKRLGWTAIGATLLAVVQLTSSFYNGWMCLLLLARYVVPGVVFLRVRRRRRLVLGLGPPAETPFGQFSVLQVMLLTTGVALFLGLQRVASMGGSAFGDVLLFLLIALLGIGCALVPLVAAAVTLAPRRDIIHIVAAAIIVIVVAASVAFFINVQTSNWNTTVTWFVQLIVEALVVAASLMVLRRMGYHLTNLPATLEAFKRSHS